MRVDENGVFSILIHCFLHQNINFRIFLKRGYFFQRAGLEKTILDIHTGKQLHHFILVDGVPIKLLDDFKLAVPEDRIDANLDGFVFDLIRKLPEYFEEKEIVHHL